MNLHDAYVQNGQLLAVNQQFYHEAGYLIANMLVSPKEIDVFRAETSRIFRGERGHVDGLLPTPPGETDDVFLQYVAIHFPHKISSVIEQSLHHPGVVSVLKGVVGPNVKAMQSMLFVKGPGKAGQAWHQDEYFIPTRDRSLVGGWIAIVCKQSPTGQKKLGLPMASRVTAERKFNPLTKTL